jgi:hypothetical protein
MGQFYTKNASSLLKKYSHFIKDKNVIDPFAGEGDLTSWAISNGAASVTKYDKEPKDTDTIMQDTILNPVDLSEKFLLTNPPYLNANKNKDKTAYKKFNQNDLYKCHLSSINCDEGIIILPSNFISESNSKIRNHFFDNYTITRLDYYYYQVFVGAKTGIVTFHFKKEKPSNHREFDGFIHYQDSIVYERIKLHKKYKWLWGDEFFEYLGSDKIRIQKWTGKEKGYLSRIVIGLLDNGKLPQGLSINNDSAIVCGDKAFTTYQLVFDEIPELSEEHIVDKFNEVLSYYRGKYHGLFLSNYMGATQKIISRDYAHRLIARILASTTNTTSSNS